MRLASASVVLDSLEATDAPLVLEYCQDPLFERYLTIPWPYRREHADGFIAEYVPEGWAGDTEYTWAVRGAARLPIAPPTPRGDPTALVDVVQPAPPAPPVELVELVELTLATPLLGVIGLRRPSPGVGAFGFWLGAPHRGLGLMQKAERLVIDWAFGAALVSTIQWECLVGNRASARTARAAGFTFLGRGPSASADRDGGHPLSWHAVLRTTDDRLVKPGWPSEIEAP
ncbi:GNAT family N-acetyltransferase [Cryobacterium psychrophilum]|uniref:GNAT family N-acetyltransferase n=1 Tax=Cryobacterium psychrophilum TaxID=41988 RepID=UPI001416F245|nr:GNAT family N-acetyltransferase [Cryobacterium psychrophilum]